MLENKEYIKTYIKEKRKLFSNAIKAIDSWDGISESYIDDVAQMIKLENNQSYNDSRYQCLREVLKYNYLTPDQWKKLQEDMEDRGFVL